MVINNTVLKLLAVALGAVSLVLAGPSAAGAAKMTPLDNQHLQSELSDYLSGQGANYGLEAVSLDNGRSVSINASEAFPAASMYKLLVMYRVFQAVDRGALSLEAPLTIEDEDVNQEEPDAGFAPGDTPTVADALDAMITVSSNSAAFALARAVGGWPEILSVPGELGMRSTSLDSDRNFWSTPSDLAHFFQLLANRALVSQDSSQRMIDLLFRQTVNDRLPALLPGDAAVAHKTGELDDVRNDGGIVDGPGGRYVIVTMSWGGDPDQEVQTEAELSRMVYDRYGQ